MIKQIFTWWNNQTFGTFLYTVFFGRFVGKDITGNKYYENKKGKRWVIYKGEINASKITSDWFSWIHHISNTVPNEKTINKYSWQKPHKDNKTGTKDAYYPSSHPLSKNYQSEKNEMDYESWKP